MGQQSCNMKKHCWPFLKKACVTATALFFTLTKMATVTDGPRHGFAPAVCPLIISQLYMCTGRAGEAVLAFSASDSLPECFKGWIHITLRLYGGVLLKGGGGAEIAAPVSLFFKCFYSSVVECQSCKLKVLGSVPSGGSCASNQQSYPFCIARLLPAELIPLQHLSVPTDMPKSLPALPYPMRKDSLAERSKAVAQGAIPRGRGLKLTAVIFFAAKPSNLQATTIADGVLNHQSSIAVTQPGCVGRALGRDFNSRGMETCRGSIPPPPRSMQRYLVHSAGGEKVRVQCTARSMTSGWKPNRQS